MFWILLFGTWSLFRLRAYLRTHKEVCSGQDAACPADALEPDGTECRASAGLCDVAETCSGLDAECPGDVLKPEG